MTKASYSLSKRKENLLEVMKHSIARLAGYDRFNKTFHTEDIKFLRFLIGENKDILDIGCGNGLLLKGLEPKKAIGLDISPDMIKASKKNFSDARFIAHDAEEPLPLKGTFDVILVSDVVGLLDDIQQTFENARKHTHQRSRIIVSYYTKHWELLIRLSELLGIKVRQPVQNFLSTKDIHNFLSISGFEVIRTEYRQLIPFKWFGIGTLINKALEGLPGIRKLCLRTYVVARPIPSSATKEYSVSIIVPCRNERGNIEPAIERLPNFARDMEVIFVEGNSKDGTWEEVLRVQKKYKNVNIKAFQQTGKGKADAVHLGFSKATGDILMILDSDLTVPPEQLPKFYKALSTSQGEFINGSRLIYPMENQAMQFLNFIANKMFSWMFSYILSQRFTDTLCGTKVFFKKDYHAIIEQRKYFGDFDPFGDFELIFGAAKLNLKVLEVPIRYQARAYGETQISRFRHGVILLRMVFHAYKKLKLL